PAAHALTVLQAVPTELAYISANQVFLADSIKQLETSSQTLCNTVATVSDVHCNAMSEGEPEML
ncbi:hypothetical protein, partial [Bradyrhizobium sp. 33ap4]|uniref:hypothetical protein n=1 Tax=Bradyrhizobium sp. 33ap4 TaxID=3061630 RepID=UPI00292DD893